LRSWWGHRDVYRLIAQIRERLDQMPTQADFDKFKADLKADVTEIVSAIADLRQQIKDGVAVTDDDLAELNQDLVDLTAPVKPPTPPPVPPVP